MEYKYTAKLYLGDKETARESGDDIEALNVWMVSHANGNSNTLHGEIIDNQTKEIVRKFRKTPID